MRYLLLSCIAILCLSTLRSQPELSLLGMGKIMQSDLYNPARFNQDGWHFALPSFNYNFYHTGPGYRTLIDRDHPDGPVLKISSLRESLKEENFLHSDFRLQTFKLKYGNRSWTFGLDHEILFHSSITYPGDLIRLYLDGNQQFIGQTIDIAPQGLIYSLNSYGFLISRRWSNLTLGLKPRLLFGQQLGNVSRAMARLSTSADVYQVSLETDYRFENAGIISFENANFLDYRIEPLDQWSLISSNAGFALDLGMEVKFSDHLILGLSVIDWGSIRWKEGRTYRSKQTTIYEGLEVVDLFNKEIITIPNALDSLRSIFELEENSESIDFQMPAKYIAVLNYKLNPTFDFSLISIYQNNLQQRLVMGLQGLVNVSERWTLGAILNNRNREFNAGISGTWTRDHWIIYCLIDQVLTNPDPLRTNSFGLRVGCNYHFAGTSFN